MNDDREGLPSASKLEQMSLCPASWLRQKGLTETQSEDAKRGDRIHQALAACDPSKLTNDEQDTYNLCARTEFQAIQETTGRRQVSLVVLHIEKRLWIRRDGVLVASAKPDVVYLLPQENALWITDYKTGRNETTEAASNLQLATQAVAALGDYFGKGGDKQNIGAVFVCIVQPLCVPRFTVATYTSDQFGPMLRDIWHIIDAANKPDAPATPGEKQCRYCLAKARCPEARAAAMALTKLEKEHLPSLPAPELAYLLERCAMVEGVVQAIRNEAKRRLEAGEDVPGWRMKPGHEREKITNLQLVWERMSERWNIPPSTFTAHASMTKESLKNLLKAVGIRGTARDEAMESLLEGACESKPTAPRLEKA